jgi:hypothetical protein
MVRNLPGFPHASAATAHLLVNSFFGLPQSRQNRWAGIARAECNQPIQKRQSTSPGANAVQIDGQSTANGPCYGFVLRSFDPRDRRGE